MNLLKAAMTMLVFELGVTALHGQFAQTNSAAINIPSSASATPYPSTINVSGRGGVVTNVTVTLISISHQRMDNIDILLVGPGGQKAIVISDVGPNGNQNAITLTLSDAAPSSLGTGTLVSGTYKPTNNGTGDSFDPPAPGGPYVAALSVFTGQSPNGIWSLYVFDDDPGHSGSLAGGWSLTITTVQQTPVITWANPTAITYGTALGGAQLNATANVPGTFAYNPAAGTVLNASNAQLLSVTFTPNDTNTYTPAVKTVLIGVQKAPLTITAENKNKVYGAALPVLTASYAGFVNGDTTGSLDTPANLGTPATAASPAGNYAITASGASSANYSITLVSGTLTITQAESVLTIVSSANPALPGSSVTFTNHLTALPPGVGTPTGNVQFKVDGTNYGGPVGLANGSGNLSTSTLAAGEHSVSVEYPGDGNFLGTTGDLVPGQVINTPPVAVADVLPRVANQVARAPVSNLLTNDSDADGDAVTFETVSAMSTNGGTVTVSEDWILYTPPPGSTNEDSFTYTVSDAWGGSSTGVVAVTILEYSGTPVRLALTNLGNGTFRIVGAGVPWGNYAVETTKSLTNQVWETVATVTADLWGRFATDDTPPQGNPWAFYRAQGPLFLPFLMTLSSSTNPALPGSTVTFTVSLTALFPATHTPTGTVQFKVDGTNYGAPVTLDGGNAQLTTTLPVGAYTISADYSGDESTPGATGFLSHPQIVNTPPLATNDIIYRNPIYGTKHPLSDLLANDSDADGGPLVLDRISTMTAKGGRLNLADGWIFYAPPAGFLGADSFTYTVRDGLGATATATNDIIPRVENGPSANFTLEVLGDGTNRLVFSGIPWRMYLIQSITNLGQTNWQSIATNTADSYGLFEHDDILPSGTPPRFYRSVPYVAVPAAISFRVDVWTNFIAHTNGRTMDMWAQRQIPEDLNNTSPVFAWNTNCLLYGLEGFTGISQCNTFGGAQGQVPVTLLTRRHGYTRGHGRGDNGLRTNGVAGNKVWFCTASNIVVQMTVAADLVRFESVAGNNYDYSVVVFTEDVPASISPVSVMSLADLDLYYPNTSDLPYVFFGTEQLGHCAAGVPPFLFDILKGGDSGSPNMLPSPNDKLIMFSGRGTSGFSPQMQADIDALSIYVGVNTNNYQLRWYDLSPWSP